MTKGNGKSHSPKMERAAAKARDGLETAKMVDDVSALSDEELDKEHAAARVDLASLPSPAPVVDETKRRDDTKGGKGR